MKCIVPALATALIVCGMQTHAAPDDSVEAFYRNKSIQFIIGYGPGGGYDLYARLLARFLGAHIPGNPSVIAQNMPGAGGRLAANYVYATAPHDGTVLLTADQGLIIEQALGDPTIRFDLRKMPAIGNPNAANNNVVTWYTSGIRTVDDAKKREVTIGGSPGAATQVPLAMNAVLKTRFKVVQGYTGGNDIDLAMERGEVDGRGQNTFASWKASKPDWLREHKINFVVQWGKAKDPEFMQVPLLTDLATNADDKSLLALFSVPSELGRPIYTTPNVPRARIDALRAAFGATMKDPAFLAAAKEANVDLNPVFSEDMQASINQALDTPPRVLDRLRKIVYEKP